MHEAHEQLLGMNLINAKLGLCIKQRGKRNVPGFTIKQKNTSLRKNLSKDRNSHNIYL